jgi:hypothetical protein
MEPAHPWRTVNRVVIVERYLGGATAPRLAALAMETDAALGALGLPRAALRYLGSTAIPEDETSFCAFAVAAAAADALADVNRGLTVPALRVIDGLMIGAPAARRPVEHLLQGRRPV